MTDDDDVEEVADWQYNKSIKSTSKCGSRDNASLRVILKLTREINSGVKVFNAGHAVIFQHLIYL